MFDKIVAKLGWRDLKKTFSNYNLSKLKADFWAGILVAVIAFPSVMAFAMLAGLNPITGLHSFIIATLVGFFFGVSDFMVMGPTNIIALMIASAIGVLSFPGLTVMEMVIALTLLTGLIQVVLSWVNFGKLTSYISRPVITGLITGVAFAIAGDQIPEILGLELEGANLFTSLYGTMQNIGSVNPYTLFIGVSTIVIVLGVRKIIPKAPDYLLAIAFSIALVYLFGLEGQLEVLGSFSDSLPSLTIPNFNPEIIPNLLSYAFAIAMLGFIDVVTITEFKNKGAIDSEEINRDFLGLGLVNVACSFFSGFAGGGSFSRSFVNYQSGAKTRLSQFIAGIFVLIFLAFFSSLISLLPLASLSAILVLVAFQMVDLKEIKKIIKTTKFDLIVFLATFSATILMPRLDYAVYFGILLSLILVLRNSSDVNYSYLKIKEEKVNQRQLEELEGDDQVIIDFSGILHFNTVCNLEKDLKEAFKEGKVFILRMRNVEQVDITTISQLEEFVDEVRKAGGDVFFAGLSEKIKDDFQRYGLTEKLGSKNYFPKEEELFSSSKKALEIAEKENGS